MKTKEDVIKEAYGEHYELVKPYIDKDGWCSYHWQIVHMSYLETMCRSKPNERWRPVALKGIENNNGWVKIESESYLPKERGAFWTFIEGKEVVMNTFNTFDDMEFTFDNGKVTHYQPIQKPKPPVF